MFKKQTYDNNIYMKIIKVAYIGLALNLAMVICNPLFFLMANFSAIDPRNFLIFATLLFFFGPIWIAVFASFDQLLAERDIDPFRVVVKQVKRFWKCGFLYSGLYSMVLVVLFFDIASVVQTPIAPIAIPFFMILLFLINATLLNALYFQVRNPESSLKDVIRISVYYAMKKWYASLLNNLLLLSMFALMFVKPQFGFLLTPTLFMMIIFLNCKKLHPTTKS